MTGWGADDYIPGSRRSLRDRLAGVREALGDFGDFLRPETTGEKFMLGSAFTALVTAGLMVSSLTSGAATPETMMISTLKRQVDAQSYHAVGIYRGMLAAGIEVSPEVAQKAETMSDGLYQNFVNSEDLALNDMRTIGIQAGMSGKFTSADLGAYLDHIGSMSQEIKEARIALTQSLGRIPGIEHPEEIADIAVLYGLMNDGGTPSRYELTLTLNEYTQAALANGSDGPDTAAVMEASKQMSVAARRVAEVMHFDDAIAPQKKLLASVSRESVEDLLRQLHATPDVDHGEMTPGG